MATWATPVEYTRTATVQLQAAEAVPVRHLRRRAVDTLRPDPAVGNISHRSGDHPDRRCQLRQRACRWVPIPSRPVARSRLQQRRSTRSTLARRVAMHKPMWVAQGFDGEHDPAPSTWRRRPSRSRSTTPPFRCGVLTATTSTSVAGSTSTNERARLQGSHRAYAPRSLHRCAQRSWPVLLAATATTSRSPATSPTRSAMAWARPPSTSAPTPARSATTAPATTRRTVRARRLRLPALGRRRPTTRCSARYSHRPPRPWAQQLGHRRLLVQGIDENNLDAVCIRCHPGIGVHN